MAKGRDESIVVLENFNGSQAYLDRTRFLFHMGDMQPQDVELDPSVRDASLQRYEGDYALDDVTHAFDFARSRGIVPVGLCIKKPEKKEVKQTTKAKSKGKINPAVLKKLRAAKAKSQKVEDVNDRLRRNFGRNYRIITNPIELPETLREIYLRTSFG